MQEIWKDIPNYEGIYQASNLGRIRVLDRIVNCGIKNNDKVLRKGKILKQYVKEGYLQVTLTINQKRKYYNVQRLIAETFLNKEEFKSMPDEDRTLINLDDLEVNHKDENTFNNCVDNLEWCTAKYNCNYGTRNSKILNRTSFKKGHIPWNKGKKLK